jgi:shikimate kinase
MMPLWLIGMLGVGKSAVAPRLAEALGVESHDTDEWVERHSGRSIARIFAEEGEAGFRRFESKAVAELALAAGVVATGGGAVTSPDNVTRMKGSGMVIWLRASPATLATRLGVADRPLLDGAKDRVATLHGLLEAREDSYAGAADLRVETDGLSPAQVVAEVQRKLPS